MPWTNCVCGHSRGRVVRPAVVIVGVGVPLADRADVGMRLQER